MFFCARVIPAPLRIIVTSDQIAYSGTAINQQASIVKIYTTSATRLIKRTLKWILDENYPSSPYLVKFRRENKDWKISYFEGFDLDLYLSIQI